MEAKLKFFVECKRKYVIAYVYVLVVYVVVWNRTQWFELLIDFIIWMY